MSSLYIPPGVTWELLVVNNNSSDDTDKVIARHVAESQLPIRPLFEPRQGHSNARNCAIDAARGDLVLWTDDDVLVSPHWISEYVRASSDLPNCGYFGGPIHPWYETPPPQWLLREFAHIGWVWAILERDSEVRPLKSNEEVYGANMAYRSEIQKRYRFDASKGHVGDNPRGFDETVYTAQLRAQGVLGGWVGSATIDHYIPGDRMTARYIFHRLRCQTRNQFEIDLRRESHLWSGVPRWYWRQYLTACIKRIINRPFHNAIWLRSLLHSAEFRGMIDAAQLIGSRRKDVPDE